MLHECEEHDSIEFVNLHGNANKVIGINENNLGNLWMYKWSL